MEKLVVVGNGMAGTACLEQILKYAKKFDITIFGDETHVNYNSILLSSVLAGEKSADEIVLNSLEWYQEKEIKLRLGVRIVEIDTHAKTVIGDDGSVTAYDKLLMATGSSALVPPIEGSKKQGVYLFRNLDDTRALLDCARKGARAVVIGGGLLGLEAARGLQVQGCDVTVVHLMDTLMERQLDGIGGGYLKAKMECLDVKVLLSHSTTMILGEERVEGVRFKDGKELPADLGVIAAGIRPNVELARKAGLEVKRAIVVNDFMETSHPDVYAVGECVEHNGVCYGLVAPPFEQGQVLAAAITGNKGEGYQGSVPAAKLKIMGVEVFSSGDFNEGTPGNDIVRYEDAAVGIYKTLILRDKRRNLFFPEPATDAGLDMAAMPQSKVVCGCNGVSKGTIVQAIQERGLTTLAQVKECTRASTGCGSCTELCQQLLKAVAPQFQEEEKKALCKCVPLSEDQLREVVRSQRLKSVQQVLDIYGNGTGCPVCKPALSYMMDVVWCGAHEEDRSARFINDRVHANIQKDGTFSVVPRIRGGVTSADELRRIADVADKYKVPMLKITGSKRIDLLGVQKADLPKIWADLGMQSGQAYAKGGRMVKTCVGTEFCRFGVQDSIATGVELERRFENLFTPHKLKTGVVGSPRNCAEATVKDIGLVGQEGSWQVVVGGAGKKVRKADLLVTVETGEEALQVSALFFQYYRENANYLERTYDFVERLGIERVRRETIYAPLAAQQGLRERLRKSKAMATDAWLDGDQPRHPAQFVQIQPLESIQ